jgi:hypothetical protein
MIAANREAPARLRTPFSFPERYAMMTRTWNLVPTLFLLLAASGWGQGSPPPVRTHPGVALLPEGVTSFGAAEQGGWLYVLGGARGRAHHYDETSQTGVFRRLDLRDPSAWSLLPETDPIQGLALVAHAGGLVRVGGMRALNEPGEPHQLQSVVTCARYDPGASRWEPLPPLPEGRSSHDAVVVGRHLYVVGGWTLEGDSDAATWRDSVLRIDLEAEAPAWEVFVVAPFRRRALAVAALGTRLYAIGGIDDGGKPSEGVDVLDLETRTWSRGPDYPDRGLGSFGVSATVVGGTLVSSGIRGTLWALSPDGASWVSRGRHTFPRFFHRLVGDERGALHVVGGSVRGGRCRVIERVEPATDVAHTSTFSLALPHPGTSRNRQGVFLSGRRLILFGGNDSPDQHAFEPENFVDEAWSIDLASMAVTPFAAFPARRQSMLTAVTGSGAETTGWVVGGFGHDGDSARTFGEVYRCRLADETWERVEGVVLQRSQAGLQARPDGLWLFGGLDYDAKRKGDDAFHLETRVVRMDAGKEDLGFVDAGVRLPRTRRAFGGASLLGRYYLVGGMAESFRPVPVCDVFDFETREWATIPAPASTRLGPALAGLGGRLYLAGGTIAGPGGRGPAESIEVFDPESGVWSTLMEKSPIPTRHLRMFALEDALLLTSVEAGKGGELLIHLAFIQPAAPSVVSR